MTLKAFSIHFLLKAKNELANLWKLKKIMQEKKDAWFENSSKLKYYYFLRKLVLLQQISLKIIMYGTVPLQDLENTRKVPKIHRMIA